MLTILANGLELNLAGVNINNNSMNGTGLLSSSKVKVLAEVDIEKLNSINEFVEYAVTNNRLEQMALENLPKILDKSGSEVPDFDRKYLGKFIKSVSADVIKEESDTLAGSELSMRDVGGPLSKKAREWFFSQESI